MAVSFLRRKIVFVTMNAPSGSNKIVTCVCVMLLLWLLYSTGRLTNLAVSLSAPNRPASCLGAGGQAGHRCMSNLCKATPLLPTCPLIQLFHEWRHVCMLTKCMDRTLSLGYSSSAASESLLSGRDGFPLSRDSGSTYIISWSPRRGEVSDSIL